MDSIAVSLDQKQETGKAFYHRFVTEGPCVQGDHGMPSDQVDLSINSDLNDPKLIAEGREFARRNYFSILLGHFVMMMFALASRYGRVVLYHTGESLTKEKARRRDLSTIVRMMKWMEGDMVTSENNNVGSKDLKIVRKIHLLAAKKSFQTSQT